MIYRSGFQCAYCGEWNDTTVDRSAGIHQDYVEDCQVCCQPNNLEIRCEDEAEIATITAERES